MLKLFVALAVVISCIASSSAGAVGSLRPPVIHETFTPLPCPAHPTTTQGAIGCAEERILATDHEIDAQAMAAFALLLPKDRVVFVQGEVAWLRYRRASCLAEASKYFGGSVYGLYYAQCVENRNEAHLRDLAELLRVLRFH